ncbi:MAG: DEAD/DEAH box helicase [Rhodocyclaceae bacterium]|nr:DEAD/DEAH box helicase [Rhodocyclaceae bacterium]
MDDPQAPPLPERVAVAVTYAFESGVGEALLHLGATEVTTVLPPIWGWWRNFAVRFFTTLCTTADDSIAPPPPDALTLETLIADAPPMMGSEYLTPEVLLTLWAHIATATLQQMKLAKLPLQDFLKARHPAWNLVGRVHFNLAENRKDPDAPFAFLATYTTGLSAHGKAQHLPLSQALAEFSGGKAQLLSLLMPVHRASAQCDWIAEMIESGEIYHPLRWEVSDALRFLNDLPQIEAAGILVRMPAQWHSQRPARPKIKAAIGTKTPSCLGLGALLDFTMDVTIDGETLTPKEIQSILSSSEGLQWIRGQWVEVDRERLTRVLDHFRGIEQRTKEGLPLSEAMRLLSGASLDATTIADPLWSEVIAGPWLAETLSGLRAPAELAAVNPGVDLAATLRPYQHDGLRWLSLLTRLGLGACLADDMGLGKTIQVLSLLASFKYEQARVPHRPSLLVVPTSLLANWMQEAERFAPNLRCFVAHPSEVPRKALQTLDESRLTDIDLVITSYGTLLRLPNLTALSWRLAIVDEAQAIKNPSSKQTKEVKKLKAEARIALTGTPVENRLSDLWSIFDFTHPGLLGSERVFADFTKRLSASGHYGSLRSLVSPYILRRMKTDKRIITDLPDKTEMTAWCSLSPTQAVHYKNAVQALTHALETTEGIERKGLVLAYLMRFKQICNHPSQWLGDGAWNPEGSGKFSRLREIAETIAAKQEKLLVFTQFRETTAPLAAFLGGIFGREGLVLHGGTPVAKRREWVKRFQEDERVPFFVLSIKAGGAGLNLTAASHVVHFDRWWNPAVENQATDRAYRIGQHRNVLVHKFVCRGTIEERIDDLIRSKQKLVKEVIEGGPEINLTEMSNAELINLVKLDIHAIEE